MPDPLDRRAALKARHRRALLDAAAALVAERGSADFGVDELAARADVSRRTVFNHFASLDDVVTAAASESLTGVIEGFQRSVTVGSADVTDLDGVLDGLAGALRGADAPAVIAGLSEVFGGFDDGEVPHRFSQTVSRTAEAVVRDLADRHPHLDRLDLELLVTSVVHGAGVIARHWVEGTGAALTPESRAQWDTLLDRLVAGLRGGLTAR